MDSSLTGNLQRVERTHEASIFRFHSGKEIRCVVFHPICDLCGLSTPITLVSTAHPTAQLLKTSFHPVGFFWTNLYGTHLVAAHQKDIQRFDTALKWIRRLEAVFALIPIKISLKMWG